MALKLYEKTLLKIFSTTKLIYNARFYKAFAYL